MDKQKVAKVELIRSIGRIGATSEEVVSPKIDGKSVAFRTAGPFDKFVAPQPRRMTIENRCKKEGAKGVGCSKDWEVPLCKWLAFQSCQ